MNIDDAGRRHGLASPHAYRNAARLMLLSDTADGYRMTSPLRSRNEPRDHQRHPARETQGAFVRQLSDALTDDLAQPLRTDYLRAHLLKSRRDKYIRGLAPHR